MRQLTMSCSSSIDSNGVVVVVVEVVALSMEVEVGLAKVGGEGAL